MHAFQAGHANAYLWRHGTTATLIDAGEVGHDTTVLDVLRHLGLDLTRILITHWHHDHTGAAAALADRTGAQVYAGRADAPVIRGERDGVPPMLTAAEEPLMASIAGTVEPAPACQVHRELHDGDTLDEHAVIIGTPGHTPGSIAVHLTTERVLLTGDISAHQNGQVILGPFNTDREQAKRSLRRLTTIDVDAVGFGHGTPVTENGKATLTTWTDPLG
ncbi:glyoxylase-like metal-dependent hydrolase (beta-lactamase superfamily II) [Herbihabitans rhizosphaerae]|uniref:Glyoxylase-like metal-dependent hydrolase (Beta-lactamase superfamily II) n=1 Tax=Herbihabitans rhizosphaerae TaxID=1872711 RepID=A0A4Q7L821_9PSEU|nr:MBL fold metallo-hydrolase [Herbihabitans rhizosphaerae]RZS45060.1 glyoxylase-like metal-dependent hydrolase (beta-lactamase superfamily II) [Herbihabitans rhizosphaerae]